MDIPRAICYKTLNGDCAGKDNLMIPPPLTPETFSFFRSLVDDAGNWGGDPMIGTGSNIPGNAAAHRGHLTALKKAALVTTYRDQGDTFVSFTPTGREFAASLRSK